MEGRTRIVVGVDGSDTAAAALRWALEEAVRVGATVEVVNAWDFPAGWTPFLLGGDATYEAALADATGTLRSVLSDVRAANPHLADVDVAEAAVTGPVVDALLARAEHADLLVLGSRGRDGLRSHPVGTVAVACIGHAGCPVVVVPSPAPRPDAATVDDGAATLDS